MKKSGGFLAVFCIAVLAACSNPFRPRGGGEGTITIAFGTQGRVAVQEDDIPYMTHNITLTGPGETITETINGVGRVNIPVAPGTWNISVRGYGPRPGAYCDSFPEEMLRGLGSYTVEVRAGETSAAGVRMISAAEVRTDRQLASAINLARDDGAGRPDGGEKIIIITDDIATSVQHAVRSSQNITFTAYDDTDVVISRTPEFTGTLFSIEGALNIGRLGRTGLISIGGGDAYIMAEVPLIEVSTGARLVMNKELRLKGNLPGKPELFEERFAPATNRLGPFSWPQADDTDPGDPVPTSVTIEPGELVLEFEAGMPPQYGQLTATVQPSGVNQAVTWVSSNPAVAFVDQTGRVTAVGAGTATITATSVADPEVSGTVSVTVNQILPGDGTGNFNISFANLANEAPDITLDPLTFDFFDLPATITITVTGADFTSVRWFLGGSEFAYPEVSPNGETLALNSAHLGIGRNHLTVAVIANIDINGTMVPTPASRIIPIEIRL